jgi:hypothetical protein
VISLILLVLNLVWLGYMICAIREGRPPTRNEDRFGNALFFVSVVWFAFSLGWRLAS